MKDCECIDTVRVPSEPEANCALLSARRLFALEDKDILYAGCDGSCSFPC